MSKNGSSQSRRQRRGYEKILKKMDPTSHKEFKKDSQARGKEIHRQNIEDQMRREEERAEEKFLAEESKKAPRAKRERKIVIDNKTEAIDVSK